MCLRTSVLGRAVLAMGAAGAWLSLAQADPPAPTGTINDVVFSDYSPLSANTELLQRLFTPLVAERLRQSLPPGRQLRAQPLDLTQEHFALYVPAQTPAQGYALLVWVSPWPEASIPRGWAPVLDRYQVIFVTAARSGNEESSFGRREPLALAAAYNVMQRYRVDSARIYVGGLSGGSRVALHLALGYPDLFRGALLNAGSDPIGTHELPLPAPELFRRFQDDVRLVYVTGEHDRAHLDMDSASLRSMRKWCVFNVASRITRGAEHELANPTALGGALELLAAATPPDPKLAACRAGNEAELTERLAKARSLIEAGKRPEAQKLLTEIDGRFGGLAAPRTLELQARLQ